jgi:hypothetical protein
MNKMKIKKFPKEAYGGGQDILCPSYRTVLLPSAVSYRKGR